MSHKKLFISALLLMLMSGKGLAQSQQVRVTVDALSDGRYQANVYYQPSDGKLTTGLGIRVHFSGSQINVSGTDQVLTGATGLQRQVDSEDFDSNTITDQFYNAAWFDLNGNWPSGLTAEVLLFRINFSLPDPMSVSPVVFNVSRVATATGYGLSASNYQASLGGITGSQQQQVSQLAGEARVALSAVQSADQILETISAVASAINNQAAQASNTTLTEVRNLADDALRKGLPFFNVPATAVTSSQVRAYLEQNPAALRFALDAAPAITGDWQATADVLAQAMSARGLGADVGERLAGSLHNLQALDAITVAGKTAAEVLGAALGASAVITTDSITGVADLSLTAERYQGAVLAVRLVGELVPAGLRFLADGRALLVTDGFAFELAPMPNDLLGFIAALERETFRFSLREDGAIELDLGRGEIFSGVVAYDNLAGFSGACGGIGFDNPQGAENSPGFAYGVTCSNGARQSVLPFVQDPAFFLMEHSANNANATATVDRNTGVITLGAFGQFKPGFFISPLTPPDLSYLDANKNSHGLALRSVDLNGDGQQDFLLYSARGVQPLFAVAQN